MSNDIVPIPSPPAPAGNPTLPSRPRFHALLRPFAAFRGLHLLRSLGKALRRRPRTTALVLALLVLAGTGVGLYAYALHRWQAAEAAVKEGRLAEARSGLDLCLFVWPRSVPVHLLAARAARLSGDFAGAEAHLNQCLRLQNGATEAIQAEFLLMRVQTGEVDVVAQELLRYVDNKSPDSAFILETLTRAYMDKLRYGPALTCLDRWVQEAPDSAQPYYWRGWVLERVNNADGAMADYQRALELDPNLFPVRLRVAERCLEEGNPPEALPHLDRLRKQYPDRPEVTAMLGRCRFMEGKAEEARRLLEAAVQKLPDDPPLLVTLAKLDLQAGRPAEAEQWVRRALKADATDPEAQYTLVAILQHQGRQEEAAAALEKYENDKALLRRVNQLLEDEMRRPSNDPNALYDIGALFLRAGQDRVGEYWLNQALELDHGHRPTLKALADYYESKGEPEKVAAYRRRLTESDKKAALP